MSSFRNLLTGFMLLALAGGASAQRTDFPGIGRTATPKEIAAWDIDIRPDFAGLPKGAGSVAKGQDVWEGKCASCHGVFGESNEVFSPLVGGTTAEDIKTGRVSRLNDPSFPGRTTLMKVSNLSTLLDYINRAMPWTQPKSLSVEELYSVTAYLLNMGGVLPDNFTLSDQNVAEVQKLMPNRNGKTTAHALWPGKEFGGTGKPDVQGTNCMKNCVAEPKLASFLPDFARNAHGNLAEQNRLVGAQHGANTANPEAKSSVSGQRTVVGLAPKESGSPAKSEAPPEAKAVQTLLQKHSCTACHAPAQKLVGPSWQDIAKRHSGKTDYLVTKNRSGGSGVWGAVPMPPQGLPEADAKAIANWLAGGAARP